MDNVKGFLGIHFTEGKKFYLSYLYDKKDPGIRNDPRSFWAAHTETFPLLNQRTQEQAIAEIYRELNLQMNTYGIPHTMAFDMPRHRNYTSDDFDYEVESILCDISEERNVPIQHISRDRIHVRFVDKIFSILVEEDEAHLKMTEREIRSLEKKILRSAVITELKAPLGLVDYHRSMAYAYAILAQENRYHGVIGEIRGPKKDE